MNTLEKRLTDNLESITGTPSELQHAPALLDVMESAGEKAGTLWRESVCRLIEMICPKSAVKSSGHTTGRFVEICIYANEDFPCAVDELTPYFQKTL